MAEGVFAPTLPELITLLREHDEVGAMHIVVSDGNMDDGNIAHCLAQPDATDADRRLAAILLAMPEEARDAAWEEAFVLKADA